MCERCMQKAEMLANVRKSMEEDARARASAMVKKLQTGGKADDMMIERVEYLESIATMLVAQTRLTDLVLDKVAMLLDREGLVPPDEGEGGDADPQTWN